MAFIASVYLLAGVVGYYSGMPGTDGSAPVPREVAAAPALAADLLQPPVNPESASPVISGRVRYRTETGQLVADNGSLILFFPDSPPGDEPPSSTPLSLTDLDADQKRLQMLIHALGGEFAHVDSEGNYSLSLPRVGTYHAFVFSENAALVPQMTAETRDVLSRYFAKPEEFIASRRVQTQLVEIKPENGRAIDIDLERS